MKPFLIKISLFLVLAMSLVGCGNDSTVVITATPDNGTPSGSPASVGPVVLPTPTPRPLVQPKVIKSVNDSRGLIEFTEIPNLTDGWPTLIWFDAARSPFSAKMSPVIASLKARYGSSVKFADLDYYEAQNAPFNQRFRITDQPAFAVVDKTGQTIKIWAGLVTQDDLETFLKRVSTP